jgi:peroxiredoxin
MSLTPSTMLALGTTAPNFALSTADGTAYTLDQQQIDKGLLVIFMCNHCPYVIHIREKLAGAIKNYQKLGIEVVAINSNDFTQYPDDSPSKMLEMAKKLDFSFPYLVDEDQSVAKAYQAACTPDLFLFDGDKKLVYRGQFDNARPGNKEPITGKDLTFAVEQVVAGNTIAEEGQRPSMGCNIKWKAGNEPSYFG